MRGHLVGVWGEEECASLDDDGKGERRGEGRRAANPSLLSLPARFCTIPSGPAAAAALCSEVAHRGSKKNWKKRPESVLNTQKGKGCIFARKGAILMPHARLRREPRRYYPIFYFWS